MTVTASDRLTPGYDTDIKDPQMYSSRCMAANRSLVATVSTNMNTYSVSTPCLAEQACKKININIVRYARYVAS